MRLNGLLIFGILWSIALAAEAADLVNASTAYGPVVGQREDGVLAFLGIPYAKAPTGELRFRPPAAPEPWEKPKETLQFGPTSPQTLDPLEPASLHRQDEDSLSLNVWTPALDNAKRPVVVFIHGGGFTNGGTQDPLYNGKAFARRGNVVFVSMNYRLGIFGWMYLAAIDPGYAESGNLGLLDQIAALRWIRDNIAGFGGDRDNVTIMGESAGAGCVTTLMTVPAAKGLFSKAIAESGTPSFCRTRDAADAIARRFFKIAKVHTVGELAALPLSRLIAAEKKLMKSAGWDDSRLFGPVIDGRVLPMEPFQALSEGAAKDIPLLHGTTKDETKYWNKYFWPLAYVSPRLLFLVYPELNKDIHGRKDSVIKFYRKTLKGTKGGDRTHAMLTDIFFRMPHIRLSEAQTPHAPVWMYQFTWPSPEHHGKYGCFHALELPFVLDNYDAEWQGKNPPRALITQMQDAWIAFARTGNPNHSAIPAWPQYDVTTRPTLFFGNETLVVADPDRDRRELYSTILN